MNADFVNPFVEAAVHTLETTASTKIKAETPYLKKKNTAVGDVTGVITISGDFQGTVSITFSKSLILHVVSTMFGEPMAELNDDIKDAVGELTNMISGQVTTKLAEKGKDLKISLSEVLSGRGHAIAHLENLPVVALPYRTDNGEFMIEVCLEN